MATIFDNIQLPKVIYSADSKYNGKIEVIQRGNNLKISVNNTTQSIDKATKSGPNRVWGRMAELIADIAPSARKILILGLGGGTMQHYIREKLPNTALTSVEIDPVMIDIAKKYFELDTIQNHEVICDDAFRVVTHYDEYNINRETFDVAVVDIFTGAKLPELVNSGNFIASLKNLVRPSGIVIFNRIYLQKYQDDVNNFIELLENFFPDVDTVTVAGHTNSDNLLIYGRV